jgi:hypothetical protein
MPHSRSKDAHILLPWRSRFSTAVSNNITTEDDNSWGLPPGMKLEDTLRLGFHGWTPRIPFTHEEQVFPFLHTKT